jgi:hypothetical protein
MHSVIQQNERKSELIMMHLGNSAGTLNRLFIPSALSTTQPLSLTELLLPEVSTSKASHDGKSGEEAPPAPGCSARKSVRCRLGMHPPDRGYIRNMGWDFGRCKGCHAPLIRIFRGRWQTVPKGYRIVHMSRAQRETLPKTVRSQVFDRAA